jgi:hypothetical protein
MQLLIENLGEAPIESFTLLGASGSRGDNNLIGQFGSGAKLAITSLLRKGLNVTVYSGLTRMCFKTKTIEIEGRQEQQVYIQFSGTSRKQIDLGWTLGFGAVDWQDEGMSLREFIANAIDRVIKDGGSLDEDMKVELVPDSLKKARSGFTRIFVEANDVVSTYLDDLPRRFLHFSDLDPNQSILPKQERQKPQIYYNGVWVCELGNTDPSLCDYNFTGSQIKIDESRNLNEYVARSAIAELYRDANVNDLARIFGTLNRHESWMEHSLDALYLHSDAWEGEHKQRCENWIYAWAQVHGDDAVACQDPNGTDSKTAKKKGYDLGRVTSSWLSTVKDYGIPTADSVLDENERNGRILHAATKPAQAAVDEVWEWIKAIELDSKPQPDVGCFTEDDPDTACTNFVTDGEVFLYRDLEGEEAFEVALEVLAKYLTGSSHYGEECQKFTMQILIRWMR